MTTPAAVAAIITIMAPVVITMTATVTMSVPVARAIMRAMMRIAGARVLVSVSEIAVAHRRVINDARRRARRRSDDDRSRRRAIMSVSVAADGNAKGDTRVRLALAQADRDEHNETGYEKLLHILPYLFYLRRCFRRCQIRRSRSSDIQWGMGL